MEMHLVERLTKYKGYMNAESELVYQTTMFEKEKQNLEVFFSAQVDNYMRDLDQMAA